MNETDLDTALKDEIMLSKCNDMDLGQQHAQSKQIDHQEITFYHEKALNFVKTLKRDYKRLTFIYNSCLLAEQERERKNQEEILRMKKIYNQKENEKIIIKRKKWCRYCESEATYLSSNGNKFYCSQECEQKQMEFANAIDSSFKT